MKPVIIVKLRPNAVRPNLPFWLNVLHSKRGVPHNFIPAVDHVFRRFNMPFWATREYGRAGPIWSPDELRSGLDRIYRLILQHNYVIPPDLIREISLIPVIETARMGSIKGTDIPRFTMQQTAATADMESRDAVRLAQAHLITKGNPDIIIAVLDTGVTLSHPEYRSSCLPGFDTVNIIDGAEEFIKDYLDPDLDPSDDVGHGTHITGIIAAQGLKMPVGVAPRCKILPVRVLAALRRGDRVVGAGLVENIDTGVKWAVDHGAHVINMSLGVPATESAIPHEEVMEYAARKNVAVIAATGNDGREGFYYPGAIEGVIAVGAADPEGFAAAFSTYGDQVMLLAPGTNIYSTFLNDDYAFSSGTSHATPFVSGAVALLKSLSIEKGHTLTNRQIRHILKHTSDKVNGRFRNKKAGFGTLNIEDSLKLLNYKLTQ